MKRRGPSIGVAVFACAWVTSVAAQQTPASTPRLYTLAKCVALAKAHFPKVAEARARLQFVRQQLSEAHTAPYLSFSGRAGVATPSSRRGTSWYSPDDAQDLIKNNQPAWSASVSGVVPLWTFGKITNLWDAAEAQVGYKVHEVVKVQNEVVLAVREAYHGWRFAREALSLVDEVIAELGAHESRLKEEVEEGDADDAELFRVQLQLVELASRRSEALSQQLTARAGLAFLVGRKPADIAIPEGSLQPVSDGLKALGAYQSLAQGRRPEVQMADYGLRARRAQLKKEQAGLFPDIGLGLSVDWSYAPGITDQRNPFVSDPNFIGVSIGLGMKWKLDFLPQLARIEQAKAKVAEVEATVQYALTGIDAEVSKAYAAAQHAHRRVVLFGEAVQLARRWFVTTEQGIVIGAYEDKDLIEPAKEHALKRFIEMNAIYDFNVAMARLSLAVGVQNIALRH